MDLKDILNIILIFCASGIIFVLPSTIYTAMFWGIFYRHKPVFLDTEDLKGTTYYPYSDELKKSIIEAKQIECQLVSIKSNDGLKLVGRYYDKNSDTTIILVHGYQSNSFNNFSSLLKYFLSSGFNVLMVDQRAHGMSEGHFTTAGCKEKYDLINWISWLNSNSNCSDIFIYGISMGATTIGLASDKIDDPKVKGLIMEAGFTSFREELWFSSGKVFMKKAALNYVVLCAKCFLNSDIGESTVEALAKTSIPVLFLHGSDDKEVPLEHTEKNFHACASEKSFLVVDGAPHTLCYFVGKETVQNKINEFIIKYQSQ